MQGSRIHSASATATVLVWILDLDGDPSSAARPAALVQSYLHERLGVCERRNGDAPPTPPPPPPSFPPSPHPPDGRRSPPPYWLRTYHTGITSMQSGVSAPLSALSASYASSSATSFPAGPPMAANSISNPPPAPVQAQASSEVAAAGAAASGADGAASGGGVVSASGGALPVLVQVSGEPAGTLPADWDCPVYIAGSVVVSADDATPPSPPTSPPPPPPPSPPSPPPAPPYVECTFIPCEIISDEDVARLEAEAILAGSSSAASASARGGQQGWRRLAGTPLVLVVATARMLR